MLYTSLLFAATTLSGLVSAQNYSTTPGDYTVTPDSVPAETLQSWCIYQRQNCPLVCGGSASVNNCTESTLKYTCTCTDGSHPNISSYANMLPSLECNQWVKDCVKAAGNSIGALTKCRAVACGNKDPGKVAQSGPGGSSGSSSSSAAPSQSASATGGSGGSTASPTSGGGAAASSSGAAVALGVAQNYGTGILAGGLLALFGLAL